MTTSSNGNILRVTGLLCGEFTNHRWIPRTKPATRSIDVSLICTWTNSWANNEDAGDLRRLRAHCDVIVMEISPRSRSRFLWMLLRGTKNYRWTFKPELRLFKTTEFSISSEDCIMISGKYLLNQVNMLLSFKVYLSISDCKYYFLIKCYQNGRWVLARTIHDDDAIIWKRFPYNWPFERGTHQLPVDSPHKGQVIRNIYVSVDISLYKPMNK